MKAVLFDLDMTLVDTSALEPLRRSGDWRGVFAGIDAGRVRACTTDGAFPPHELPRRLRDQGVAVGIVTSTPGDCARKILQAFDVPFDTLVGWHDTDNHKPHPAPILVALQRLGIAPADACYVGDDRRDVEAAVHAGVTAVGVKWSPTKRIDYCRCAPDVFIGRPEDLCADACLLLGRRGYVLEVMAAGDDPILGYGSTLRTGLDPPGQGLGRYFATKDPRSSTHALSRRILDFKDSDQWAEFFAGAIARILPPKIRPDYLVAVPPKSDQSRDRFRRILDLLRPALSPETQVVHDGLRCVKPIPSDYKTHGRDERESLVAGAYQATRAFSGRVILVDDVLTSGATARVCCQALIAAGAESVSARVFGKTQDQLGNHGEGA